MSEISPARLAANRANALHSTGPTSPEGKAKSALNGLVHGLRADTLIIPGEDPAAFEVLRQEFIDELKPQTVTEQHLLDTMAAAKWHIARAHRQEQAALTKLVDDALAQCDPTDLAACEQAANLAMFDGSKAGALRLRYLVAQDNIFNRAMRNLMSLRRLRLREEKAAETARRQRERDEKAASKRSVPSEPKPIVRTTPLTTAEIWERVRNAPAPQEESFESALRTAPIAPARC